MLDKHKKVFDIKNFYGIVIISLKNLCFIKVFVKILGYKSRKI